MQILVPDADSNTERRLMLLVTDSFDDIDTSSFERETIVDEDSEILQSPECNPMIIDESLANDEGLTVGDTFELPNNLTEDPVVFIIGAIYRRTSLFSQYDAVILCNEQTNPEFFAVAEDIGYNAAYIRATDLQALKDYLENEFVPALIVENNEMTQEEIDAFSREEAGNYYEDYITHCGRSE